MQARREPRSPWQKYGKVAFHYSPLLNECATAVKNGQRDRAEQLAAQHRDRWHGQFVYGTSIVYVE